MRASVYRPERGLCLSLYDNCVLLLLQPVRTFLSQENVSSIVFSSSFVPVLWSKSNLSAVMDYRNCLFKQPSEGGQAKSGMVQNHTLLIE